MRVLSPGSLFLSFLLVVTLSCNKNKKEPVAGEEPEQPTSPSPTQQPPWETMGFAENTPLKIKKEIYNWRAGVCTFADLYEFQFMEQPVYLLNTGCSNDPLKYLYDTTGTILCALDGSDEPECLGTPFAEAYNKRFIWATYNVFPAGIAKLRLINKQVELGSRTFLEVHANGASDKNCVFDRYEIKLEGNTYFIKTFYKLVKTPSSPASGRTELRSNIEITPPAKGTYILRADSTAAIADTLVVL